MGEVVRLIQRLSQRGDAPANALVQPIALSADGRSVLSDDPVDQYSQLLPMSRLLHLEAQVRASLAPAGIYAAENAVIELAGSLKVPGPDVIADPAKLREVMIKHLAEWPAAVLPIAVWKAQDSLTWFPVHGELRELCKEELVAPFSLLGAIGRQLGEHARRQHEHAERRDRENAAAQYLTKLLAAFGGETLDLADIELATRQLPIPRRGGQLLSWREFAAEPQAAKCCLRLALVARLLRAWRDGRCGPEDSRAVAGCIIGDEAAGRFMIQQIEARAPASIGAGTGEFPDVETIIADIEAAAGLDRSPRARPRERSHQRSGTGISRKTEMLRQKLFRYAAARLPDHQRQAAIHGLCADDQRTAQRWFDELEAEMTREGWDDTPSGGAPAQRARSLSEVLAADPFAQLSGETPALPGAD